MAVKKKKSKKKSPAQKKKAAVKKARVKRTPVARKKPASKKKTSKTTQAKAKTKAKVKTKTKTKKAPAKLKPKSAKPSPVKSATSHTSSGKKPSGKNIGKKVKTLTGRWVGKQGEIVRQDAYLGTYFITFDSYRQDSAYKDLEWGPYFESQLEFLKK